MSAVIMESLPTEIMQSIAVNLDFHDVKSLVQTSRSIRNKCDKRYVYKGIIARLGGSSYLKAIKDLSYEPSVWKMLAKVSSNIVADRPLLKMLYNSKLVDTMVPHMAIAGHEIIAANPARNMKIADRRSAFTLNFCAAHALLQNPRSAKVDMADNSIAWFTPESFSEAVGFEDRTMGANALTWDRQHGERVQAYRGFWRPVFQLGLDEVLDVSEITELHDVAYRFIAVASVLLHTAFTSCLVQTHWAYGHAYPKEAEHLMQLPKPPVLTQHLPEMLNWSRKEDFLEWSTIHALDAKFWEQGKWTGMLIPSSETLSAMEYRMGPPLEELEFRVVEYDTTYWQILSTYTRDAFRIFRLDVFFNTSGGYLEVNQDFGTGPEPTLLGGIVTPFGLVLRDQARDYWIWLWKRDWVPEATSPPKAQYMYTHSHNKKWLESFTTQGTQDTQGKSEQQQS